jgi:outer membrane receptor protein involved in Fe transport
MQVLGQNPTGNGSDPVQLQRVEIKGNPSADDRKDASAAKSVLTRQDIERFGDTNLIDLLQRVPSITISGSGNQVREIRLRGLGNGYTQILVDGQPVPRDFPFDSMSPDSIERIEVIRSATADMSAQSIAGSINIILRRVAPSTPNSLKASLSSSDGVPSGTLTGQLSGRDGPMSYSSVTTMKSERNHWPSATDILIRDGAGQVIGLQHAESAVAGRRESLGVSPRLVWQPRDQQSLSLDSLVELERFDVDARQAWQVPLGTLPFYPMNTTGITRDTTQARVSLNWKTPVATDGRFDLKLMTSLLRRQSDSQVKSLDYLQREALLRSVVALVEDRSLTSAGNYALTLREDHYVKAGWDLQLNRRDESRTQRESSAIGAPTQDLDQNYDSHLERLALFVQDEMTLRPGLSAYLGIRWEQLKTRTSGNELQEVDSRSTAFSPILQVLWKIPHSKSDQLRINLSRTYKAPTARNLIPRRWIEADNSVTSPDFQGNPNLLPELAWGLDIAYEHYLQGGSFVGLSAYGRRIRGVVQDRLFNDNGRWVITPENSGPAQVLGVEFETKGTVKAMSEDSAPLEYRFGMTRNWSSVQAVPPPKNRLQEQPLMTASLGVDYGPFARAFTLGGNVNFEHQGLARTSATQSTSREGRWLLDVYGLWRSSKVTTWRLTFTNLIRRDVKVKSTFDDGSVRQEQIVSSRSFRAVRLLLDTEL